MVVIIGATGFIGMYTVERFLKEGTKVFATGRNPHTAAKLKEWGVPCIPLDISREEDFDKLPTEDVEAVILLGGLYPRQCHRHHPCAGVLQEERNQKNDHLQLLR